MDLEKEYEVCLSIHNQENGTKVVYFPMQVNKELLLNKREVRDVSRSFVEIVRYIDSFLFSLPFSKESAILPFSTVTLFQNITELTKGKCEPFTLWYPVLELNSNKKNTKKVV